MRHNFKKLKIWEYSIKICIQIYKLSGSFPKYELFGLQSQINRAAISIPSNIAEGTSRESKKEFQHFLSISLGSSFEVETQLILAHQLQYISGENYQKIDLEIKELQQMISGFKKSLEYHPS